MKDTDIASPTLTRSSSSVRSAAVGWCRVVEGRGTAVVLTVTIEYGASSVEFRMGATDGATVVVSFSGRK